MNRLIKYGLIIVRDNTFLINRKYNTTLFLMPRGKPEKNETIEDCLVREIKEEHQVDLQKDTIKHFGDFEDIAANESNTTIFMKVYLGKIVGEPKINEEIEEQRWFGKNDDPEILSPIIKNKILPEILKQKVI